MRGIIFTEFIELVESRFGFVVANKILDTSELKSGGVYTAVGTYPHEEIFILVEHLSQETGIPVGQLLRVYGEYLFRRLMDLHPQFVRKDQQLFPFLESIQHHIHVEVKKIHPQAELPHFESRQVNERSLELLYTSQRDLADLAFGLLKGAITYFESPAELSMSEYGKGQAKFIITLT